MEKISVIVPVRNGEAWIQECLNSIQNQTWTNLEVLVVDNGSVDNTAMIVEEIGKKDSRIRLHRQKDQGVSAGRNQGIEGTDGEFVTFVDADDKIEERMLEKLAEILKKEKSDIAICDYIRWNGEKKTLNAADELLDNKENAKSLKTVDVNTYVSDYLLRGYTRCWSILYRREAIGKVRFRKELTIGEDMMFLMDLLKNLKQISITSYQGYYYRINPSGAMLRPFTPSYMDEIKAWKMASKIIGAKYPGQKARVSSILAVSAILVAGKLSRLSADKRREYDSYVKECRETVKAALKVPGAKKELPSGYGIKTTLFRIWPEGYLQLYHIWKK